MGNFFKKRKHLHRVDSAFWRKENRETQAQILYLFSFKSKRVLGHY